MLRRILPFLMIAVLFAVGLMAPGPASAHDGGLHGRAMPMAGPMTSADCPHPDRHMHAGPAGRPGGGSCPSHGTAPVCCCGTAACVLAGVLPSPHVPAIRTGRATGADAPMPSLRGRDIAPPLDPPRQVA